MKMPRFTIFQLGLLMTTSVMAQVSIDAPILFNGTQTQDRQLNGLEISTAPGAVLTASVAQSGETRTSTPLSGATWSLSIPSLEVAPIPGTHLVVISPAPTTGPVSINVNSDGPYALVRIPGEPINGEDLIAGTALSVIFDGTAFQLMNGSAHSIRDCPSGTVAVDQQYCIDVDQRGTGDFFATATACGLAGMRMCGWGEFIVACQKATVLGLQNMTNDWEWTGDASNEDGSARVVGQTTCLTSGNGLVSGSLSRGIRCCYTR